MAYLSHWYDKNWRWFLLGCLFLATFLNYFDRQTLGIAITPIAEEFGLSNAQRGNLLSAFLFTYAGAHLFIGFITDRIKNIRVFFPIMVLGWSVSTILVGFVQNYESILWLRYLLGIWEAVNFPIGIMLIAKVFPKNERSLATGIFGSGAFVATLLAPKMVIFFSNHYDWRVSFVFAGSLGILWLIPWFFVLRDPNKRSSLLNSSNEEKVKLPVGSPMEVLRSPGTWIVAIMGIGLIPCLYFSTQWLPTYFTDVLDLPYDQQLGNFLLIIYLMLDTGLWVGGYIVMRLAKSGTSILMSRKIVIGIAYLMILVVLVVPYLQNISLIVFAFALFVFGIGMFLANQHAFKQDVVVNQVAAVAAIVGFTEMMFTAFVIKEIGIWSNVSENYYFVFYMLSGFITLAVVVVFLFVNTRWFKLSENQTSLLK